MDGDESISVSIKDYVDPTPAFQELAAMQAMSDALDGLDPRACGRVLRWAKERYPGSDSPNDVIMPHFVKMLERIGDHQKASLKQPRNADRELWDGTIKGSKFWTDIPAPEGGLDGR